MTNNHDERPEEARPVEALPGLEDEVTSEKEEAPPGVRTMAMVRWALVAVMAVLAAASVLHYCGTFKLAGASQSAAQYYCPMHPSVVQDHPGECPICSMTLVKKAAGAPSKSSAASQKETAQPMAGMEGMKTMAPVSGGSQAAAEITPAAGEDRTAMAQGGAADGELSALAPVELTPERIQLIGMKTQRATREKLVSELRAVGFVAPDEERLAQITTRFAGWIEQLLVSQTGQRVSRGQVLATVYSPELLTAQQEFLNARKWSTSPGGDSTEHQLTSGLAQDARQRLELLGISREEIKELERTGRPVPALRIRSPVNGYVLQKNALPGMYVQPGTELFEVADLSKLWVLADIYEYEIGRVHVGEPARLKLAAFPGETFQGRVQFIYPTLNSETRTLRVRLVFPNPDVKLRPGMYGDVFIELPGAEGLMIPTEALVDTGEAQYVFVALPGGRFEPRQVRVGARSDSKAQVLEGLRDGDTVVTTGNFLLDSESRIRASIEGAVAASAGGREEEVPIDKTKYPDKYRQWKACEIEHRGMGTMEQDCQNAIAKPWR